MTQHHTVAEQTLINHRAEIKCGFQPTCLQEAGWQPLQHFQTPSADEGNVIAFVFIGIAIVLATLSVAIAGIAGRGIFRFITR